MLQETLAFAVRNIPRYRNPEYRIDVQSAEDLARLPIVSRHDLLADPVGFASSHEWPCGVAFTSGTTGMMPRPRWRSTTELEAVADFAEASDPLVGHHDTSLVVHPYTHGPLFTARADPDRIYVGLLSPWQYEHVRSILIDGWPSPKGVLRVTRLESFSPGLRTLTCWLEQQGMQPGSLGVRALEGSGSLQPQPWRKRLERTWNADYQDRYGLTEVTFSSALECFICGAYHFVQPIVVEVVDPVSRQPIEEGTGVLVLSELYPYAQLQVLLRYWTDDLAEIAAPCVAFGFGFHLRGRHRTSVVIPQPAGPPLVVGDLQVADVCARQPDVAVSSVETAPWAADAGLPRCCVTADSLTVKVTVASRYPPSLFPERAGEVSTTIRTLLLREVTGLSEAVDSGPVELVVEVTDVRDPSLAAQSSSAPQATP